MKIETQFITSSWEALASNLQKSGQFCCRMVAPLCDPTYPSSLKMVKIIKIISFLGLVVASVKLTKVLVSKYYSHKCEKAWETSVSRIEELVKFLIKSEDREKVEKIKISEIFTSLKFDPCHKEEIERNKKLYPSKLPWMWQFRRPELINEIDTLEILTEYYSDIPSIAIRDRISALYYCESLKNDKNVHTQLSSVIYFLRKKAKHLSSKSHCHLPKIGGSGASMSSLSLFLREPQATSLGKASFTASENSMEFELIKSKIYYEIVEPLIIKGNVDEILRNYFVKFYKNPKLDKAKIHSFLQELMKEVAALENPNKVICQGSKFDKVKGKGIAAPEDEHFWSSMSKKIEGLMIEILPPSPSPKGGCAPKGRGEKPKKFSLKYFID